VVDQDHADLAAVARRSSPARSARDAWRTASRCGPDLRFGAGRQLDDDAGRHGGQAPGAIVSAAGMEIEAGVARMRGEGRMASGTGA
jgi:hypothetical protein